MEGGKKAREVKGLKEGGKGEEEREMRGMGGEAKAHWATWAL